MKIVSAKTITGYSKSLDRIGVSYLVDGDYGIVNDTHNTIMYRWDAGSDVIASHPNVIAPIDAGSNGRWLILGITSNETFIINELETNTITSSAGINIDSNISFNGGVNFPTQSPPFAVNNDTLCTGLNVDYINGFSFEDIVSSSNRGMSWLPENYSSFRVVLPVPEPNTDYVIVTDIVNTVDPTVSKYSKIIVDKGIDWFDVKFSGIIDSTDYILMWSVFSNENTCSDNECGVDGWCTIGGALLNPNIVLTPLDVK